MKDRTGLVASILGVAALWLIPAANAQVTVTSVKVTVSSATKTAVWCNISAACAAIPNSVQVWDLGATGKAVGVGQTLVLAQTNIIFNQSFTGGNFDTSDRATLQLPNEAACSVSDHCTVTIDINGSTVYSSSAGDALNVFNADFPGNQSFNEASQWATVFNTTNYSLALGYADNEHTTTCPATGCFPHPFADATTFIGNGIVQPSGSCPSNCWDSGALLITGVATITPAEGRMTGGGSVFTPDGTRVTHGFELHCDVHDLPNNLEINWDGGNNFHLEVLTSAVCTDDAAIIQKPPVAPFDTFIGTGTGKLNGVPGASIAFTLVDGGEPGTKDTATYVITDSHGTVLTVPVAFLDKGNQQAHN